MVNLSTTKNGELFVRFSGTKQFVLVKIREWSNTYVVEFDNGLEMSYSIDGMTEPNYKNIEEVVVPGTVDLSSSRRGRVMFQDGTVIDRANVEPINNGMFAVETEPLETWITYRADGTFADDDGNPLSNIIRFDPIPDEDEEASGYAIVRTETLVRCPVITQMPKDAVYFEIIRHGDMLNFVKLLDTTSLSHEEIVVLIRKLLKSAKGATSEAE